MLIRAATEADAEAVATTRYRGLAPDDHLNGLSYEACLARWAAGFGGATRVYVAELGDQVVGFISVGPCSDADARAAGEVWDLWVLAEHRSAGIGGALLGRGLADLAREHQVGVVWVLEANERARTFYERHSAVRDGTPGCSRSTAAS